MAAAYHYILNGTFASVGIVSFGILLEAAFYSGRVGIYNEFSFLAISIILCVSCAVVGPMNSLASGSLYHYDINISHCCLLLVLCIFLLALDIVFVVVFREKG